MRARALLPLVFAVGCGVSEPLNTARGRLAFDVSALTQQQGATVTIINAVRLVVTSSSGGTVFSGTQTVAQGTRTVEFPLSGVVEGLTTFRAEVLSNTGVTLYDTTTTANVNASGFLVTVRPQVRRPVLGLSAASTRLLPNPQFNNLQAGTVTVFNVGTGPMRWQVDTAASSFMLACGGACGFVSSGGSTVNASGTLTLQLAWNPRAALTQGLVLRLRSTEGFLDLVLGP